MNDAADAARTWMAQFTQRLTAAIGGEPLSNLAAAAGMTERRLRAILAGAIVPDLADVRALEVALDVDLWPSVLVESPLEPAPRPLTSLHDQRRLQEERRRS